MSTDTPILDAVRNQVGQEIGNTDGVTKDNWQEKVDESINKMSNVDLLLRIDWAIQYVKDGEL